MNILFLNLSKFESFEEHNIYTDLLRSLIAEGHNVYAVCSFERRNKGKTRVIKKGNSSILLVKTLNIQKTNVIEKAVGTILITRQYISAINKYFGDIKFDLILYPTPPITLYGVVKYYKQRDLSFSYLLLKDIFPQNAVDLGMLQTKGVKSIIYKWFRKKETMLYKISDKIGCMSAANVNYILAHNKDISTEKVEIFPNCIETKSMEITEKEKLAIREKYGIPNNKKVFVYGGNLGKPQSIPFVIDCLKAEIDNGEAFYLIVGDGTEYKKLENYYNETRQSNFKLIKRLSTDDFNRLLLSSDVGLIFLDDRFTIPNFPSRLLSYLQAKMPVLACTDKNTDIKEVLEEAGCGKWCESNSVDGFKQIVKELMSSDLKAMGQNGFEYLQEHYTVEKNKDRILRAINRK